MVPLYFAAERPVVERGGMLIMVDDERLPLDAKREARDGARALPHARLLSADRRDQLATPRPVPEIIEELIATRYSERQGRVIDHDQSGSMEKKKQEGYF